MAARLELIAATMFTASTTVEEAAFGLSIWLGMVVLAVVLTIVVLAYLRRRLHARGQMQVDGGFTLEELRQLRERSELSDAEFDALRRKLMRAGKRGDDATRPQVSNKLFQGRSAS